MLLVHSDSTPPTPQFATQQTSIVFSKFIFFLNVCPGFIELHFHSINRAITNLQLPVACIFYVILLPNSELKFFRLQESHPMRSISTAQGSNYKILEIYFLNDIYHTSFIDIGCIYYSTSQCRRGISTIGHEFFAEFT